MLQIEQLEVTLDGQRVLGPLDLRVAAGELLVLAGPSGSGKSTLLRALAGLVEPAAGRMLIDGDDLAAKAPGQRGVAMVFQNYALFPHLTIEGNLARARAASARNLPPASPPLPKPWASAPCSSAIRASSRAASVSAWRWRAH
jgi:2-aminoethylphosphonate transport system ATP-binding protein